MKIVLIAPNASQVMGGEAIKAYQYFAYLLSENYDVVMCTHARCKDGLLADFPANRLIFIPDDKLSAMLWNSRIGRPVLGQYFLQSAKKAIVKAGLGDAIWHYVTPISPVEPKPFPKGTKVVIGPLNGNIYYPDAFRQRSPFARKLAKAMHKPMQQFFAAVWGDKKRAAVILNSGFQRTRDSLRWAGVADGDIIDVLDSGLPAHVVNAPVAEHTGRNGRFVALGRLVDVKGYDMAIRALEKCASDITLTIYGQGEDEGTLKELAEVLGVQNRVEFAGWMDHKDIAQVMAPFRGFIFPTLADANGIAMQEMMMMGIPVITLKWGGPERLATDDAAKYIIPDSYDDVVDGLAAAMTSLADDPMSANVMATKARRIAESGFIWDQVGQSWAQAYTRTQ